MLCSEYLVVAQYGHQAVHSIPFSQKTHWIFNATGRATYLRRNIEALSCNHCCGRKASSIKHSECEFVALASKQSACAVFSSVVCSALQYFSTLSHTPQTFRKKLTEYKMYFVFLHNFLWNISHAKKNEARYDQKRACSSCKVPVILLRF